jgi:hypothetical protein
LIETTRAAAPGGPHRGGFRWGAAVVRDEGESLHDAVVHAGRNWRDLIRPKALPIERTGTAHDFYGKFVCEPLERGFGITIGNSLRRVLLSSLQGAAITAVRIDGALHEFTTIDDVKEDVTDIILNLKEVVFQRREAKRYTLRWRRKVPARGARRGHQGRGAAGIEVLNPGSHVATVSKGGKLSMELIVGMGRGYVPAERNKDPNHGHRLDRHRLAVLAGAQGELHGHQRPRRADDRLRQAHARGVDQRRREARGTRSPTRRRSSRSSSRSSSTSRRPTRSRPRRSPRSDESPQREPLQVRRTASRVRALGAQRQLPPERQHLKYIGELVQKTEARPAQDQELRPQVELKEIKAAKPKAEKAEAKGADADEKPAKKAPAKKKAASKKEA